MLAMERQKRSQWWKIQRRGGLMANLQSEVVDVEDVMPTLEDQKTSKWSVEEWMLSKRLDIG